MRAKARWGFIVGSALWFCSTAMAVGFGPMTVRSQLGQPLEADIELAIRDKRDLEGLSARIASPDAYRRANIPFAPGALGLQAVIQTGADGRAHIRVHSTKPVTEPTLKLLIELSSGGAQTLREYDALLDPPEVQRR